jgi:hypothetical protein
MSRMDAAMADAALRCARSISRRPGGAADGDLDRLVDRHCSVKTG